MIISFDELAQKYKNYGNIKTKIAREVKAGNLFQIAKGLYETDNHIYGKYLAGVIYGPSYLSFYYALYEHGLISEAVYNTFTSATFNKRKRKEHTNHFGKFLYRDIPIEVYPLGIEIKEENNRTYQIAIPEKAICDKLYSLSPVSSIKQLNELLFNDLRIDESEFINLNFEKMQQLAPKYKSTNLTLLLKLIKRRNEKCNKY